MRIWLIRNPYLHDTWKEILFRERFFLIGIKERYSQKMIRSMNAGDMALFYDKQAKEIKGVLELAKQPYQDFTNSEQDLFCAEFVYKSAFQNPVSLSQIKDMPVFSQSLFLRQARFSIVEINAKQYQAVVDSSLVSISGCGSE